MLELCEHLEPPPALPCPGWSCLPSSASCSVPVWGGIWVMHKVLCQMLLLSHLGSWNCHPARGMATELSGRSWDCTQRASQQKRKPYIVISSFTFLWYNSEKYQICWIIDMFTPLMSCAPGSALPRTAPETLHLFEKDFMPCSEQQTPKSSCSCFPPRSAAAAEQLL